MNIVQVVGGPGSGKTTLAKKLVEDWPGSASLLRIDRYLRERGLDDGDDFVLMPSGIDWPLLMAHLDRLAAGEYVVMPVYDWEQGIRRAFPQSATPGQMVESCDWLVLEGLYYVPHLPSIRLFVDAPADVRQERASARDTRLSKALGEAYDRLVEPAYQDHILPQREAAQCVLDGRLDREQLATRARRFLASRLSGWG
ncbi:MAG: hypothetical protein JXQ72_06200 [Anaerolineae bacterium]|nr:hypothetical protein [Anaerolineae bacterium]